MNRYNKFNIFLREHYLTFLFVIILSPFFIGLDFTQEKNLALLDFAIDPAQNKQRAIPLSALIILVLSIWSLKDLWRNNGIRILFFLVLIYIGLNLSFGITRAAIVGLGMMFIIVSYYIFLSIINNRNAYKNFYVALSFIVIVKLIFDVSMNLNLFPRIFYGLLHSNYEFIYKISSIKFYNLGVKVFTTPYFINNNIRIYNFYDYFSFIYFLSTALSAHNLLRRRYLILSIIVLVFSNLAIIGTHSRLFIYSIYLIPFLYIFYQSTKLSLERYFYLFLFVTLAIVLIVSVSVFKVSDPSLMARYHHIHQYFENFSLVNLIFPFLTQHRIQYSGSLHNELLEIFSFFGFVIVYYLFLIKQIFCNTKKEFKFIAYLLIFVLIIGSLIQINISNPYVGIITGAIFAVISSGPTKIRH